MNYLFLIAGVVGIHSIESFTALNRCFNVFGKCTRHLEGHHYKSAWSLTQENKRSFNHRMSPEVLTYAAVVIMQVAVFPGMFTLAVMD